MDGKLKILLAHRDENFCNSLSFILESNGYRIEQVDEGWKALFRLFKMKTSGNPVDLLIIDVDISCPRIEPLLTEMAYQKMVLPTLVVVGLLNRISLDQFRDTFQIECLNIPFSEDHVLSRISNLCSKKDTADLPRDTEL